MRGFCPIVFPEGERSPDGKMHAFQSGIGLMAVKLGVPVVPICIEGLYEIYSVHHEWPTPGSVRVQIGRPVEFGPEYDYQAVAQTLEQTIRGMRRAR